MSREYLIVSKYREIRIKLGDVPMLYGEVLDLNDPRQMLIAGYHLAELEAQERRDAVKRFMVETEP